MTLQLLDPSIPADPRDPMWGPLPWPDKIKEFHPHQLNAISEIVGHFLDGVQVILLNAPTGSGKGAISEGVRRLLEPAQTLYVCNTIQLQMQMKADFPYAQLLKGRGNYPVFDDPLQTAFRREHGNVSAADCIRERKVLPACRNCDRETETPVLHCATGCHPVWLCPYEVAKRAAFSAELAVTNTAYFITEANGPGQFSERPFVIVDEADTLEATLMAHITVEISARRRAVLDLDFPKRKTVESAWLPWCRDEAIPKVQAAIGRIGEPTEIADIREMVTLTRLLGRLQTLETTLEQKNALYDGYQRDEILFRPIRIDNDAPEMLWRHGKQWLLMSATFVNPIEYTDSLGIEAAGLSWAMVNVPSTFPVENRPIFVRNCANMVWRERDTEWPKMADGVKRVLAKHPDDRTLIHSVSYDLTTYLCNALKDVDRPVLTYKSANERVKALEKFRKTPAAVLVAPSMDRGIDLPGDDARVVIICKVPFLSIKDKQVERRLHTHAGDLWYRVQAIRGILQMSGRHVRSSTDVGFTYILDSQFRNNLWKSGRSLFPPWWVDALDFSGAGI